ncbi:hypothetical protein LCGC14_1154490 [marine sediment metagenome]|uniref:Uncharacterized protein n=1 Tax=marine sediment metagenome TaxID=412755 RepID=A0A0F9PCQ7_9ZZZZ
MKMEKEKEEKIEIVTFSEAITIIGVVWAIAWVFVELIKGAG